MLQFYKIKLELFLNVFVFYNPKHQKTSAGFIMQQILQEFRLDVFVVFVHSYF